MNDEKPLLRARPTLIDKPNRPADWRMTSENASDSADILPEPGFDYAETMERSLRFPHFGAAPAMCTPISWK
jgi:hypothetical protein